jgi:hypothetical protein
MASELLLGQFEKDLRSKLPERWLFLDPDPELEVGAQARWLHRPHRAQSPLPNAEVGVGECIGNEDCSEVRLSSQRCRRSTANLWVRVGQRQARGSIGTSTLDVTCQ